MSPEQIALLQAFGILFIPAALAAVCLIFDGVN